MSKKFRWREITPSMWEGLTAGYWAIVTQHKNYWYSRSYRKEDSVDVPICSVSSGSLIQAKAAADLALQRDWSQFPLPLLLDPPAKPENADERSIFGHGCPETSQANAGEGSAG